MKSSLGTIPNGFGSSDGTTFTFHHIGSVDFVFDLTDSGGTVVNPFSVTAFNNIGSTLGKFDVEVGFVSDVSPDADGDGVVDLPR